MPPCHLPDRFLDQPRGESPMTLTVNAPIRQSITNLVTLMLALSVAVMSLLAIPAQADEGMDIMDAAREGDNAAIERYHDQGGDLSITESHGYTPFIMAAYYGHTSTLALLKGYGVDACAVDERGSNAFMGVAFRGHVETADWLLANTDCAVNHRNDSGQTALMMASLFGRETIIRHLLDAGADPGIADQQGNTAESLAAAQGLSRIVTLVKFNL
ncbi:ankyrin repeat domain-containing protein [Cobetia crustatorum]|uniref:Ankyrin repeat domain-containing protein n=2 Tax=Cobetia crustatorum TaxID=553385 RepID=A0A558HQ51_9GAMM|nr:ankyrin repeat domain-containing protein [Cobetia crustatorum]